MLDSISLTYSTNTGLQFSGKGSPFSFYNSTPQCQRFLFCSPEHSSSVREKVIPWIKKNTYMMRESIIEHKPPLGGKWGRVGEVLFTPDCTLPWSYLEFSLTNSLIPNSKSILFLQEWDFCKSQRPLALQAVKQNQACKILSAEAIFSVDALSCFIPGLLPTTSPGILSRDSLHTGGLSENDVKITHEIWIWRGGRGESWLKWFLSSAVYTEEAKNQISVLIMLPLLTRV